MTSSELPRCPKCVSKSDLHRDTHYRTPQSFPLHHGTDWELTCASSTGKCLLRSQAILLERDGDQAREVIHQRIHLYALQAGLLRYTVFQVPSLPTMIPSSLPKTLRNSTKHRALITTLQVHIFRKTVVEPSLNSTRSF